MPNDVSWSNVSFTPSGQSPVRFGDVTVTFPGFETILTDYEEFEDILGPIGIRIEPLSRGDLPTFPIGQVGTFQGTVRETGCVYSAVTANVYISTLDELMLDANSSDGFTSPIAVTRM